MTNLRRSENSKLSVIAFARALFILAASAQAFAQNSSDFSNLQKHIDKQVTVVTQDGHITGRLLRVEESRLVVYEAGKPKSIQRESVKTVTRHKSKHTVAWVGGMAAAGLGTGFLFGLMEFNGATYANRKIATTAWAAAGGGAAAGYALSRIGKRDEVVYQSE